MKEPLPLATVHAEILFFLRGRDDAVLFGAQAVNAYVTEARMTQDVDMLSTRAKELAEEMRKHLSDKFHIAARTRAVAGGIGFRVYQRRKEGNRHLADVRQVDELPPNQIDEGVRVLTPPVLLAQKVIAIAARGGQPKGLVDRRDVLLMLAAHPHLKTLQGEVADYLATVSAGPEVIAVWQDFVETAFDVPDEDDDLSY